MVFVDLEKVFDRAPRKVIWWAREEWIVRLVQRMYANAWSRVCVDEGYSEEFEVKVGVHQGSVLSLLLFIIVLEALSRQVCPGVPCEDLYASDPVVIAELLEECVRRLLTWKEAMEEKGLKVNAGKIKIMICGTGLDLLQSSGKFPCAVCRTGVGSTSIFCNRLQALSAQEMQWVQALDKGPWLLMYMVPGNCTPLRWQTTEGSPSQTWQAGDGSFLFYLWDMLSRASDCKLPTTTRVKTAWKKFKELLWILPSCYLSFKTHGCIYSSCVWSAMLHASETWPLTKPNLQHLQQNDRAMIRQTCNVKPQNIVTTRCSELLAGLGIEDQDLILKERKLRWCGHVECSNGAVKTAFDIQVDGKRVPGRPKKTWKQLTERDWW